MPSRGGYDAVLHGGRLCARGADASRELANKTFADARYERRASRLWSPSSFSVSRAPASAGQRLNDPSSARLPDIIGQTSPPGP